MSHLFPSTCRCLGLSGWFSLERPHACLSVCLPVCLSFLYVFRSCPTRHVNLKPVSFSSLHWCEGGWQPWLWIFIGPQRRRTRPMLTLAALEAPEGYLLTGDGQASVLTILPAETFLFGPWLCHPGWGYRMHAVSDGQYGIKVSDHTSKLKARYHSCTTIKVAY